MLSIPLETVAWIIVKAREFDMKQPDSLDGEGDGSDALGVLEDRGDDATGEELESWITDLTDTQRAELVALFWLGRDDEAADEFPRLIGDARANLSKSTAKYLLGSPMLGDHLEAGLETLGYDVAEVESSAI